MTIAVWAAKEAIRRSREIDTSTTFKWPSVLDIVERGYCAPSMICLAETIEKYETDPVDPDLVAAREAFIAYITVNIPQMQYVNKIRSGEFDSNSFIRGYLAAKGKKLEDISP